MSASGPPFTSARIRPNSRSDSLMFLPFRAAVAATEGADRAIWMNADKKVKNSAQVFSQRREVLTWIQAYEASEGVRPE
ncbi:hypothetical protein GCM10010384_60410 [Streptomyces djakartensis]|uniref:Uncharacterized protein n=1 Tax=Streptomyces djakartensis TaxID=68193 RepID=A0ABQ3AEA7_9ACTN|nr:hypothetical protein GCM10010384_60410 [Streptomyces djakartensis]